MPVSPIVSPSLIASRKTPHSELSLNEIESILEIIKDFAKRTSTLAPTLAQKLLGYFGELLVCRELYKRGIKFTLKSGHSSYDILLDNRKRVEIRTSFPKQEGLYKKEKERKISYYGWRLKTRDNREELKFDIVICIALDLSFSNPRFFILTSEEVMQIRDTPKKGWRFPNVQKKIHLFDSLSSLTLSSEDTHGLVSPFEIQFNHNQIEYENKWEKLNLI